jgi:hypothetical protein
VTPDGTTVYAGNGDEFNIRRIKDGYTMTLFADGWRTVPTTPWNQGWLLGGPMYATANGTIYVMGGNPPRQPSLRRIVPVS